MYNSQYYTCEQIDERLLQGYLDDYNTQTGQSLTKAQFLTKLGSIFSKEGVIDNTATQIGYYECDTAAGTAAKTITVANYALFAGGSMKVKFANKNTANNATLNINSQGAKALYYQGERASATNSWDANEVVEIYYDGTSYYANNVKGGSGSGVYDVSKEHPTAGPNSDGKFTLEYILNPSNVNELIPVNKRYPGMSIQFVSTSDNKYVQYRLMATLFSTTESDWQGVDSEPTVQSHNLVESGSVYPTKIKADNTETKLNNVCRLVLNDGYYLNSLNEVVEGGLFGYTDYIEVNELDQLVFDNQIATGYNTVYFYYYDADKNVIASTRQNRISLGINIIDIPLLCKYVRLNYTLSGKGTFFVSYKSTYKKSLFDSKNISQNVENYIHGANNIDLKYTTISKKAFGTFVTGEKIVLETNNYRDIRAIDIEFLHGIISLLDLMALSGDNTVGAVITDKDNVVLDIINLYRGGNSKTAPMFVNTDFYNNAKYVYYICALNSTTTTQTIYLSSKIEEKNKQSLQNNIDINGVSQNSIINYFKASRLVISNPIINDKPRWNSRQYSFVGIIDVYGRTDTIQIPCLYSSTNLVGYILTDSNGDIIHIHYVDSDSTLTSVNINLSLYSDAKYLYFVGIEDGNTYIVTSLGAIGIKEDVNNLKSITSDFKSDISEIEKTTTLQDRKTFASDLSVGDAIALIDNSYRSIYSVDVNGYGYLKISGILAISDNSSSEVVIVNSNSIILGMQNTTNYNTKQTIAFVNLDEYPTASKVYFVAPSTGATGFEIPIVKYGYKSLNTVLKEEYNQRKGIVLLHFDAMEPDGGLIAQRQALLAEYGFIGSACLNYMCFGTDSATPTSPDFSSWRSEKIRNEYIDAIKAGWDFAYYPSLVAGQKTEAEWDSYIETMQSGLSALGICNITTWACGRLDINDDLLNSCKKHNFKIMRGGGAADSQSTDTYDYQYDNEFMTTLPTNQTFIVNKSSMVNYNTDVERLRAIIQYCAESKTARSLFAHKVLEETTDQTNITIAKMREILQMLKTYADAGLIQVMSWREYYAYINRLDGYENDYNRIIKSIM